FLGKGTPRALFDPVAELIAAEPGKYSLTDDPSLADLRIGSSGTGSTPVATWVYALVAPFPSLVDGVSREELQSAWQGTPSATFAGRPLLVTEETLAAITAVMGEPAPGAVVTALGEELLPRAWAEGSAWAIVPFEALEPRWKVLRVDGRSPLD
ncbi:MAG: hypothetical protein GTN78_15505, partial [Gemmatimonadales bacterium]|nr:hypothetical protein [Gemmatimonadales bacterium]